MALYTYNPTSNTTPDPAQGGIAVTGNTNTGHAATTATGNNSIVDKSCVWSGFPAASGQILSSTLKVDWSENGSFDAANASNDFKLGYSLNGGGAWTNFFDHVNITGAGSGTAQVSLSVTQDLTQVRVRDFLEGESDLLGAIGTVTATVSAIRIEVTTADGTVIAMM